MVPWWPSSKFVVINFSIFENLTTQDIYCRNWHESKVGPNKDLTIYRTNLVE